MKTKILVLIFTFTLFHISSAQKISGVVKNESDMPIPGATVSIKGTSMISITDVNGNFNLYGAYGEKTIQVTYVKYKTLSQQINILQNKDYELKITLYPKKKYKKQPSTCTIAIKDPKPKPVIEYVEITGGAFTMGSPTTEVHRRDDEDLVQVNLGSFKMSKYEITFEEYDAFCEATGRIKPDDKGWGREKRPVINVSWHDAVAFAEWIGGRLPTEAEWEYACRAGTTTPFSTGDCIWLQYANYDAEYPYLECKKEDSPKRTLPVGSGKPNSFGLYDMHGNVMEWVSDWYGVHGYKQASNPRGPSWGQKRVCRGGSWFSRGRYCRSANRNNALPNGKSDDLGFRVVFLK